MTSSRLIPLSLITASIFGLFGCGSESNTPEPGSNPTPELPLETALRTGDYKQTTDPLDIINGALAELERLDAQNEEIKRALYSNGELNALFWHPTHDSAIINPTYGVNETILNVNKAFQDDKQDQILPFGIAGHVRNTGARFISLGGNPMRDAYRDPSRLNEQMHQFLANSIQWLVNREINSSAPIKVVITQMMGAAEKQTFSDEEGVRDWLTRRYGKNVSFNIANECDAEKLTQCLSDENVDLVFLSQHLNTGDSVSGVEAGLDTLVNSNIPVFYMHLDGNMKEIGPAIFDRFDLTYVGDNYWRKLEVNNFDGSTLFNYLPDEIKAQKTLLTNFKNQVFNVDLSQCDDKACDFSSNMDEQFDQGAESIRETLTTLDSKKRHIFDYDAYRYQKLLVLLGDSFRSNVYFPMDKLVTAPLTFLKSYYADHVVYNSRSLNYAQPDLGNFSRSDFSHITPMTTTVDMVSKVKFKALGVYALPGQTFTATRLDSEPSNVSIFINTLRDGATHEFSSKSNPSEETGGYSRPKYLKTPLYSLESNETVTFTSAHGGPIQIYFDDKENGHNISIRFEGVGRHPIWRDSSDDQAFTQALNDAAYDWAEIVTAGFEVHSRTDKMLSSFENTDFKTPSELAEATQIYTSNYPHVLAGFQGPGIDVVAEIHDFANNKGWEIEVVDFMKHMNADQATCGYGCSGNPYDAYWSFNPVGHGDLHELGHGLEKGRFRFEGFDGHASTNYYSYYSKSRYFKETGNISQCQDLPFDELYNELQTSLNQPDPELYMRDALPDSSGKIAWAKGTGIMVQLMMAVQDDSALQDGWNMYARLHTLDRAFATADNSDETWLAARTGLGFSSYELTEAKAMGNNDWLLIALSTVTERDLTDYLSMWGFTFSDKALVQVASTGYPSLTRRYFFSDNGEFCQDFQPEKRPLDGVTPWVATADVTQ